MKKVHYTLWLFILCLFSSTLVHGQEDALILFSSSSKEVKKENKYVYGYLEFDVAFQKMGLIRFPIDNPDSISLLYANPDKLLGVGAFGKDLYYVFHIKGGNVEYSHSLASIDLETGEERIICQYDKNKMLRAIDLTYDHATSTMYALQYKDADRVLLATVDLTSGVFNEVAVLRTQMKALAATLKGDLYGLGADGALYRIDKANGNIVYKGSVGITPVSYHSMDFDHDTEKLYWTGVYFTEQSRPLFFWNTIDTTTGKAGTFRPFANNAQIGGLYVSYNATSVGAPGKVENLHVRVSSNDLSQVELTWQNPTKDSRGENLGALSGVKIYRDRILIHDFPTTEQGSVKSYIDNGVSQGMKTYRIIPYNAFGDGFSVTIQCFVGKDTPAKVQNLILQNKNNGASLSWEKPLGGFNNGWCDTNNLSYEIVRYPDSVNLGITTSLVFMDENFTKLQNYWYKITPKNNEGIGESSFSDKIALGSPLIPPFRYDFYNIETFKGITMLDNDKDGYEWRRVSNFLDTVSRATYFNPGNNADDYLFLPPMKFQEGKYYKLSFQFSGYGPRNPTSVRVVKGAQPSPSFLSTLSNYPNTTTEFVEKLNKTVIFGEQTTGIYYIGWHVYGLHGYNTNIHSLLLEEIPSKDMASIKLAGNTMPSAGEQSLYTVEIENKGALKIQDFHLKLVDLNNRLLAQTTISDSINPEEKKKIQILWTPNTVENLSIRCIISAVGDQNAVNDTSSKLLVRVQPSSVLTTIKIGEDEKTNLFMPFAFSKNYSYTQNIYKKEEFLKAGKIEKIAFFNQFGKEAVKQIRLYALNTTQKDLENGFIDRSLFTKVVDQEVRFPMGVNIVEVELQTPFIYNGDNLCIAAENPYSHNLLTNSELFYISSSDINSGRYIYSDSIGKGIASDYIPDIMFGMEIKNGASLSGKITDAKGVLSNVLVEIKELGLQKYTDSLGCYDFGYIPEGSYTVFAQKYSYLDYVRESMVLLSKQTLTLDIRMDSRPRYLLTGSVLDLDDIPIESALIKVSGYDTASTITDANGYFNLSLFASADYEVSVLHDLYQSRQVSILMPLDRNLDMGKSNLAEHPFAPYMISSQQKESDIYLKWLNINKPEIKNRVYDDNTFENGTRFNSKTPTMLGNLFPGTDSGIITHICVSGLPNKDADKNILLEIHIFDKDRNILSDAYTVVIPESGWTEVPVGNVSFSGDFYVMLSWKNANGQTNWLAIDENGPAEEDELGYEYSIRLKKWRKMTEGGLHAGVFSIRAKTIVEKGESSKAKSLVKSVVYRLDNQKIQNEDQWVFAGEVQADQRSFIDVDFSKLPQGIYRYAVKNIYKGNENVSSASFSNKNYLKMYTSVKILVDANTFKEDVEGAEVVLSNASDRIAEAYVNEGNVVFDSVLKGNYELMITKDGFKTISQKIQVLTEDRYEFGPYVMEELIEAPKNLLIENMTQADQKNFHWNTNKLIFENFEEHESFAINSSGRFGWTYVDGDDSKTQSFLNTSFSNMGEKMAFLIFTPSQTSPSLAEISNDAVPYSGKKFLAGISALNGPNADYIISPKLYYTSNFHLAFVAKNFGYAYGTETIEVGVSAKTNDIKDFSFKKVSLYPAWAVVYYPIPKSARYICIKYTSNNKMMAMIDDIYIGIENPLEDQAKLSAKIANLSEGIDVKALSKYEIYLDGELVGETNKEAFLFTNLKDGTYEAGVKAVYTSGVSSMKTIQFEIDAISNEGFSTEIASQINLYPNPARDHLNVEGEYERLEILDMKGRILQSYTREESVLSLQEFPSGLYFLKVYGNKGVQIKKFIVKR